MKITERYRRLSFWNKFYAWAGVASILSLIIGVAALLFGKSSTMHNSVVSHGQTGGVTAQNVTINNYFDKNPSQAVAFQQYLKGKYPLGYAVFAADRRTIEVPDGLTFERDYAIRWSNAKVIELKSDRIELQLPDLFVKPLPGVLRGCRVGMPREVGHASIVIHLPGSEMIVEVLADKGDFVVLALGFKENP